MSKKIPSGAERGGSMVEFAVAFPLFLLLVFGLIEFSRLAATNGAVHTAAREAARYGSSVGLSPAGLPRYVDCSGIRQAGIQSATAIDLMNNDLQISYDNGPGAATFAACPVDGSGPAPELIVSGDRIAVTVSTNFQPVIPMLGGLIGSRVVTATDVRSIEKG